MDRLAMTSLLVLLAAAGIASAGATPSLFYTTADAGNGWTAYSYYIDCDDAKALSFAVNMSFWSPTGINQIAFLGSPVNNQTQANQYDGVLGYEKEFDTWVGSAFSQTNPGNVWGGSPPLAGGYSENATSFSFSLGTPTGQVFGDNTFLCQIVAKSVPSWEGDILRDGLPQPYPYVHADSGGPYVINPGDCLLLDADQSWPYAAGPIDSYKWDLDHDGSYETDAGNQPHHEVTYSALQSLGLLPGNTYSIGLLAETANDYRGHDFTTLTITPEPATIALLGLGAAGLLRKRTSRR